ncbi:DUF4331 family protein [Aequorivita ciconiae]|nr:DUF4331 family protein [Aequorivita sp. H23M31]
MKNIKYYQLVLLICVSMLLVKCYDEDTFGVPIYQERCSDGIQNGDETGIDCGGSECEPCSVESEFAGKYRQVDQMGRPAVNMLFNIDGLRDSLNVTVPYKMQGIFQQTFENRIMVLDTTYTTNVLGLNAEEMAAIFSKDVLWVAENGPTSYYDGSNILTGRGLGEDVMDANLLWIFGGPDGNKNNDDPLLIQDGVPSNDAPFLNTFPYLAPPF